MKKHIFILALLISACISAEAQFSVGIKAGVNYSSIDADNLKNSSVTGYQAGAFVRVGGAFYLQPELYLSSSGGQFRSIDDTYNGTVKFTNLNLPVLVGLRFGPSKMNLRIMAGPVFTSVLNTSESLGQNFSADFGNYKTATVDGQAGAGIDFGPLTVDLRYQEGLSHINDNDNQRQNLWALSVGFKIL